MAGARSQRRHHGSVAVVSSLVEISKPGPLHRTQLVAGELCGLRVLRILSRHASSETPAKQRWTPVARVALNHMSGLFDEPAFAECPLRVPAVAYSMRGASM